MLSRIIFTMLDMFAQLNLPWQRARVFHSRPVVSMVVDASWHKKPNAVKSGLRDDLGLHVHITPGLLLFILSHG